MQLNGLLDLLHTHPDYKTLLGLLRDHQPAPELSLISAARPFVTMALAAQLERPILYITSRVSRAYNVVEQLPVWDGSRRVLRFAEPGPLFYEYAPWSDTTIKARITTLAALCPPPLRQAVENPVIVCSARALMQKTLPVREFKSGSRVLRQGGQTDLEKLLRLLIGLGYQAETITVMPGTFSRRGGIVDIFPIAAENPVRIEFFGDEIESIRRFDPDSQRSQESIPEVIITPAREALPRHTPAVARQLEGWFTSQPDPEEDPASTRKDFAPLENGAAFPELEYYLPYLYSYPAGLLNYAPDNALIIIDDLIELRDIIEDIEQQALAQAEEKRNLGLLPPGYSLPYLTWDELFDELSAHDILHLGSNALPDTTQTGGALSNVFSPGPRFTGQIKPFIDYLIELQIKDNAAIVITRQAKRLAEIWGEQDRYQAPAAIIADPVQHPLQFVEGALGEGWTMRHPEHGPIHLLTDAEIFGWQRPEPRRTRQARPKTPEASFADLQSGDYVVHVEYGIGRFEGLRKRTISGDEREYLVIQYAGTDQLFVPIHQADRLARYIGSSDAAPPLSKLGTADWSHAKESTKRAVEEVARELLVLYAARASVTGHAFGPDTPWQHELEAAFPYIETEDQLTAIVEVKQDMEHAQPMDRLICGDVGYGKTEVALRAAFKAVMDGKQVAMLVPTTVLAQQHFNTFTRRLAPFPIKVEMLSRFRDRRAQRRIVQSLAEGAIDIIIGTHRLLQDDITLHDLGLLIIDEEQRFGVTHKEKLKQMRTEVDVLTMTATPIPRTLYMALSGIRDISTIQTAPEERLPVNTHIGVYDRRLIRQAILREMERGGQVYFVHNRVQTIQMRAQELQDLVPEATIQIAHGQMDEGQLEHVMLNFAKGEFDVLVCTTIIESGVDIPNANTMIIDRADWFGLAQLYQLRGRVGRGAARAYAYFFHPSWNKLTDDSAQRLQTIKEYNELGSGFYIAMRDLEIRGAGDILGARQSGHIAAVGFHLYTQMLAQAVNRLKQAQPLPEAQPENQEPAITIDLPLQGFIPTDYIADMGLRLQLYRRLADLNSREAIDSIADELADRFGPPPGAVTGLLFQLRVKLLAKRAQATAIGNESGQILIRLPYLATVDRAALQRYLGNEVRVSRTAVWLPKNLAEEDWQRRLVEILRLLDRQPESETQVA
ncbi:MAG: transcription-repair coupling factor [Anaerolineae bacterium]|nr:transcription-repair coupling factor [Anaerolineae bacterium]